MAEMLGETADEALAPGSRFARVLANVTPETTVTLWCYPDSFETFRRVREELHRLGRVRILGTDIDRASLLTAARAEYPPSAFSETPPELLDRLFPRMHDGGAGDVRLVASLLRGLVSFQRRDLLRDLPELPFHLVQQSPYDEMCGLADGVRGPLRVPIGMRSQW